MLALAATLASALLYGGAFPPVALRVLAWVALAPLLVALRQTTTRSRALALAWVWTVAAAWTVGDWFPRAVSTYYEQPLAVGLGFFLGVSTLMAGVQYGAFALAYRALGRRPSVLLPLLAAAAWVAAELARTDFMSGNPWALAGYSQAPLVPLVQIVDLTGVYGISFSLVAVNAALAELWLAGGGTGRRRALGGLAVAATVVAAVTAYGLLRQAHVSVEEEDGIPVAIVQGNLDVGSQWRPELYGRNLDAYLRLTDEAVRRDQPALVIWPESAMNFFLDEEPGYSALIARVTGPADVQLLAGGPREERRGTGSVYYNAAFVLAPGGVITARYDKELLVPFAEYFPLPAIDLLRRRFGRVRTFSPGTETAPLPTRAGAAGILICNEAMFGGVAARRVRDGATYLVNLANDSWLGDDTFSAIALETVSLRAVESRRYLLRASTSGPSAIVDPLGRVTSASPPSSRALVAGMVHPRRDLTVYARVGDAFAWACVLVVVVALSRGLRVSDDGGRLRRTRSHPRRHRWPRR